MYHVLPPTQRPQQLGLSLIELMIAMTVGLILIAGVLSIYFSSHKSYGINNAVGQIQENARAALNFMRVNTRMAGYLGCGTNNGSQFVNQLSQFNTPTTGILPYDFGNAITGFEYNGTAPPNGSYTIPSSTPSSSSQASWAPTLSTSIPTSSTDHALPGSDIFAVSLSEGTTSPSYVTSLGVDYFDIAANNNLTADTLPAPVIVSNCVYTAVTEAIRISNGLEVAVDGTGPLPAVLAQGAQVTTGSVVAYYVGAGTDGAPALFEAITDMTKASGFRPEEIAPDVENMQVLYGVNTGSDLPSQYVTANNIPIVNGARDWNSVISVRVGLLLRSAPGAVPMPAAVQHYDLLGTTVYVPKDTRLRQVFTATIGLRNRLLRP